MTEELARAPSLGGELGEEASIEDVDELDDDDDDDEAVTPQPRIAAELPPMSAGVVVAAIPAAPSPISTPLSKRAVEIERGWSELPEPVPSRADELEPGWTRPPDAAQEEEIAAVEARDGRAPAADLGQMQTSAGVHAPPRAEGYLSMDEGSGAARAVPQSDAAPTAVPPESQAPTTLQEGAPASARPPSSRRTPPPLPPSVPPPPDGGPGFGAEHVAESVEPPTQTLQQEVAFVAAKSPAPAPALERAAASGKLYIEPATVRPTRLEARDVGDFIGEVMAMAPSTFGDAIAATLELG